MNSLNLRWLLTRSTEFCLISSFICVCLVTAQTVRKDVRSHPNWKILDRGEDCGMSASDRIVGGKTASLGQYPWMARIAWGKKPITKYPIAIHGCAGTIISDRYIVTAAHCSPRIEMPTTEIDIVQVRLGEYDVNTNPDCVDGVCAPPVLDVDVEEVYCHTGYEKIGQYDDICLVRLAKPIPFSRYIYPICLPVYEWFQKQNLDHTSMEVAGWGITDYENRTDSHVLMTLKVPVLSMEECKVFYPGESEITHRQFCAGGVVGQDSCVGDSGGPLAAALSVDGPPRYFLMGVVSYGDYYCGKTNAPGVYTKMTEYLTWILDHIRK